MIENAPWANADTDHVKKTSSKSIRFIVFLSTRLPWNFNAADLPSSIRPFDRIWTSGCGWGCANRTEIRNICLEHHPIHQSLETNLLNHNYYSKNPNSDFH